MEEQIKHVHSLIAKAENQHDSQDAQRFAQAALNAANALLALQEVGTYD